jgi:hypothetical protein
VTGGGDRPPRVAYLVMSHKNPEQVEALAARILELSPGGQVAVHHDAAATDVPWDGKPPARAHLVPPVAVQWGDWSVVDATLRLLHFGADELDADWYVLLSGEDRPVRDLATWERALQAADIDGLVPARELTQRPSFGRPPTADDLNYARYALQWRALTPRHPAWRYVLGPLRRMSRYMQPAVKIEYAARRKTWMFGRYRPRRLPPGWALYSGSQWMALGRRAVDAVFATDPSVTQWFRHTWIPDQGYIHTVLSNHGGLRLRGDPLTYVVPHISEKSEAWMVLRTADVDAIARSGAAFARKFDASVDPLVLGLVDEAVDAAVDAGRHLPSEPSP